MLERYAEFCYDQIGSLTLEYIDYFQDLRPKLSKADIRVSLPEYASMTLFSTMVVTVTSLFILGSLFALSSGLAGLIIGISLSIVVGGATLVGFFVYPSVIIRDRASRLRDQLPFATLYMSTLAGTGTEMSDLFRALSEQEEEYGEVAKEAERITRDIDTFGMDISEALKRAAERTPSENFRELIWGMNHVITTGGSLRDFLRERARALMTDYERRIEEFADKLSLLVEMYITLVIVGSIIFTSMSAVMSSFTTMPPSLIVGVQVVSIFFVLPLISILFIILVRGISPGGIS